MQKLRECGIYALPDESEVVAVADVRGSYLLYHLLDWPLYPHSPATYEVYASGQIHCRGAPTNWSITDLRDTERTGTFSSGRD